MFTRWLVHLLETLPFFLLAHPQITCKRPPSPSATGAAGEGSDCACSRSTTDKFCREDRATFRNAQVSGIRRPFTSFLSPDRPATPKSHQLQISTAASPDILHHTVWRMWLFIVYWVDAAVCRRAAPTQLPSYLRSWHYNRTQHVGATSCNMLRAFGHHVAQCFVRLANPAQPCQPWSNNVVCNMVCPFDLGFTRTREDYTTISHYFTYTFLFKRLGECTFLTFLCLQSTAVTRRSPSSPSAAWRVGTASGTGIAPARVLHHGSAAWTAVALATRWRPCPVSKDAKSWTEVSSVQSTLHWADSRQTDGTFFWDYSVYSNSGIDGTCVLWELFLFRNERNAIMHRWNRHQPLL